MVHLAVWIISAAIVVLAGWLAFMLIGSAIGGIIRDVRENAPLRRLLKWLAVFTVVVLLAFWFDVEFLKGDGFLPGVIVFSAMMSLYIFSLYRGVRWLWRRIKAPPTRRQTRSVRAR